jgi:hypothetical protein
MYPAGGPVFRSFFLMMKYGMAVPLARVMAQVVPGREAVSASEVTISLTWAVVLLGLAMWMWTSSRFQDWLFEDHIVEGV